MAQFHPYITNAALTVTGRRLSEDENGKSVPGWRERSHAANLGVTPHDGYRKPLDGRREPRWRGLPQWRGASRQVVACPLSPFFGRAIADAVGEDEEPACQGAITTTTSTMVQRRGDSPGLVSAHAPSMTTSAARTNSPNRRWRNPGSLPMKDHLLC